MKCNEIFPLRKVDVTLENEESNQMLSYGKQKQAISDD